MMEEKNTRQYALKGHGILLLVLAFLAAAIYYFAHPLPFSGRYQGLPGIGFAITHWMLMAGALIAAFREDKKRFIGNFGGYFLLAAALLLGACYGIFGNRAMRLMNAPVLVLVSAQAIFAFCLSSIFCGLLRPYRSDPRKRPIASRGWAWGLLSASLWYLWPFCCWPAPIPCSGICFPRCLTP